MRLFDMNTLGIDIGNTRLKAGLFKGNHLLESLQMTDWTANEVLKYCNQSNVRRIMLSSVAEPDEQLLRVLKSNFELLELSHETRMPFENQYTTPHTLGKDRLAAVAGAQALYPRQNCLVVDCGTCIKYDAITATGHYLGGNIAPGATMRTKAMHHFTARLPDVEMNIPTDFIGNSTESALQNGAFRGATLEISGFVNLFQQRLEPLIVILTGGDAQFFAPLLDHKNLKTEPDLTLYGLNYILLFNAERFLNQDL